MLQQTETKNTLQDFEIYKIEEIEGIKEKEEMQGTEEIKERGEKRRNREM